MGKDGGEQAFARDEPLARTEQLAHEATAALIAAVAEHGGHADAGVLPNHCAGLCDGAFTWIELDLDELQFLAFDFEIDIVVHVASFQSGN